MKYLLLLIIISCGRESPHSRELLSLPLSLNEAYDLKYWGRDNSTHFSGKVEIAGAGLHLKLKSTKLKQGFLFLLLDNNPRCGSEQPRRPLWPLNGHFPRSLSFTNGFALKEKKINLSFNFYQLTKYLRTAKRDLDYLDFEEKFSLGQQTLLFYYANTSYASDNQVLLLGCAEFHST